MCWGLCFLSLLLGQFTGGGALRLVVSPYEGNRVIFFAQGSIVNLTCSVTDGDKNTDYQIAWYRNNIPHVRQSSNGTLALGSVSIADGGWYTCATSSDVERYEFDFLLVVGGGPTVDISVDTPYEVQTGTRVELPCFPRGTPQPDVRWFFGNNTEIIDNHAEGLFRIDPTTQSLVIINTTEALVQPGTFFCEATNMVSTMRYNYTVSITPATKPSLNAPTFPFNGNLFIAVDQNMDQKTLECASGSGSNTYSYSWSRNGDRITGGDDKTLSISRNMLGSGFYCCEISNSSEVLNTHCTTVVFRSNATIVQQPTLPPNSQFYLPRGRRAALICLGNTDITSTIQPKPHYDPPNITWISPEESRDYITNDFTDEQGLAYRLVEIQPETSGTHTCSGHNSVSTTTQNVSVIYINRNNGSRSVIRNGLAESDEHWTLSSNASAAITNYMNENVFMLSFSNTQSIADVWLSQEIDLPEATTAISISGRLRVRQSQRSNNQMRVYPVIQVVHPDDDTILRELQHPVKGSEAWQWVEESLSINGMTNLIIKLALETDEVATRRRRQNVNNRIVFFDDINVTPTCREDRDVTADNNMCPDDVDDWQTVPYAIIAGAGGGAIFLLLLALLCVCCCCFCCRKGKDNAQPMRKMAALVKKASRRYHFSSRKPVSYGKNSNPPIPVEYEVPVGSVTDAAYETLQGNYRASNERSQNGEYTSINPHSLDEPSYYTSARSSSPLKNDKEEGRDADEGGVQMYLEVLHHTPHSTTPSHTPRSTTPSHTPRSTTPSHTPRPTTPVELSGLSENKGNAADNDVLSPDVLEGDTVDVYEYVNADLGPQ